MTSKWLPLSLAAGFALVALAAFIFGCWGLFTDAGMHRFDEMDGMIPVVSLLGSSVPAVVAVVLTTVAARR